MSFIRDLINRKRKSNASPPGLTRLVRQRTFMFYYAKIAAQYGWISYILGLVWLLLLPFPFHQKNYYVDENALMPAQTRRYFGYNDAAVAIKYQAGIREVYHAGNSSLARALYIEQEMKKLGLDAGHQTFTFDAWSQTISGVNAYAVFRAPRGDGTESIVISAPWTRSDGSVNLNAISYMLSFASFVRQWSFWAKDLIFLISDQGTVGTEAWLRAYHGLKPESPEAKYESLDHHGGVIMEAINLEFAGDTDYSYIGIVAEGLNGQLSNADVISTVVKCAEYEGVSLTLGDVPRPHSSYLPALKTLLRMVERQAMGLPVANHALFPKYKIEAITLVGVRSETGNAPVNMVTATRLLESILRSFNNLLEHLHHSFWFYFMPSPEKFIPISMYIGPMLALIFPLLFMSLSLWWRTGDPEFNQHPPGHPTIDKSTGFLIRPKHLSSFIQQKRYILIPAATLLSCFGTGVVMSYLPAPASWIEIRGMEPMLTLVLSMLVLDLVNTIILAPAVRFAIQSRFNTNDSWRVLNSAICSLMALTPRVDLPNSEISSGEVSFAQTDLSTWFANDLDHHMWLE
ncbi:hypothetical protein SeLEV6574_g05884 [Synchytrium endobioticum]|uniref:Uncharacterized protein n=1 Tax=Synchytrium endobioticum TaxID=286115 RepID=A0A507CS28_9FUNG|nr:hypothetical protein SeLEV6574_g05884 [Synchytrium endobioticum]